MSGGGMGNVIGSFGTLPDILMGKKPKDALLDNLKAAAMVGTGMAVAPAMFGTAAPALAGETTAAMAGVPASVIPEGVAFTPATAAQMGEMGVSPGSGGLFQQAMGYAKPIGQAAGVAKQSGLLGGGQSQPITPSPMLTQPIGGNQVLNQLAQAPSGLDQQMQLAEQMRQKRRMGLLGGGYGSA